jgi:hypothetical protein
MRGGWVVIMLMHMVRMMGVNGGEGGQGPVARLMRSPRKPRHDKRADEDDQGEPLPHDMLDAFNSRRSQRMDITQEASWRLHWGRFQNVAFRRDVRQICQAGF